MGLFIFIMFVWYYAEKTAKYPVSAKRRKLREKVQIRVIG